MSVAEFPSGTSWEPSGPELDELARRFARDVTDELATAGEPVSASTSTDADPAREALVHKLILARLDRLSRELLADGRQLTEATEDELIRRIRVRLSGASDEFERLLAADPSIENVDADAWDCIWVTHTDGTKERIEAITPDEASLNDLISQAAARDGRSERRFDRGQPWVSFPRRDGSRLTAVRGDIAGRTVFSLRRHAGAFDWDLGDLYSLGTMSSTLQALFDAAVNARLNPLVVGGADAGKTTFCRGLAHAIDSAERLVTAEDCLELGLSRQPERHPDVVELECREANVEGVGEVTMRDLTRLALRLNPDRVIVGEVRGPEVLDMFQAMCQGNDGSMGTLHARSSADAFVQITRYALKAPEQLTPDAVAVDIAASLDWVIHIHKLRDGRRVVSSVREITGYEGAQVISNEVFAPDVHGRATYTGVPFTDLTLERLADAGFDADLLDADGGWVLW